MSAPAAPARSRSATICKILGAVLLVLGIMVAAIGISETVHKVSRAVVDTFDSPVFTTPGDAQLHLRQPGTYQIMQAESYRNNAGTNSSGPAVTPADAALIGPVGLQLALTATRGNDTVGRGGQDYFDIMSFEAPVAGDYRLSVFEPAGVPLTVVPSLGDTFGRAASWVGVGVLGVVSFLIGVALLIIGFYLSQRGKKPPPLPAYGGVAFPPGLPPTARPSGPPPGWYPDPTRSGAMAWWDGTRWRQ